MPRPDDKWRAHAQMAPQSPWDFVLCCETRDEHDSLAGPKLFPELAMYRILTRMWLEHDVFFLEKSRQHMFTWLMVALILWDAVHHQGRRNIIGSTHQGRADKVTQRTKVLLKNLDKRGYPHLPTVRKIAGNIGTSNKIEFLKRGDEFWDSQIESVPQGPDAVISETLSVFFDDETHFQPDAAVRYEQALPAILGGGKYVTGGSPNGKWTFAYRMQYAIDEKTGKPRGNNKVDSRGCESVLNVPDFHEDGTEYTQEQQRFWIEKKLVTMSDKEFNAIPIIDLIASCPGLEYWITCDDTVVFRMHYRANPHHDPVTEEGREWYAIRRPNFTDTQWARQFEISYDISDGQPVVDNFAENQATFVRDIEYNINLTLDLTWDFGTNGACVLISQKRKVPGFNAYQTAFLGEVFVRGEVTAVLVQETLDYLKKYFPHAFENLHDTRSVTDAAGNQSRDTASDNNMKRSNDVIRAAGFRVAGSKKVGITAGTEWVRTIFARVYPTGDPPTAVVVHSRCKGLIEALATGWRYPEITDQRSLVAASKGHPVKDGHWEHWGDDVKYRLAHDHPDGKDAHAARADSEKRPIAIHNSQGVLIGWKKRRQTRGRAHAVHSI